MLSTSLSFRFLKLFGINVKVHSTLFILFLVESLASLRFIRQYPLFSVLVIVLYGPILIATTLVHEWGHAWMCRRLLGRESVTEIILWPLGGYTYCDGLSRDGPTTREEEAARDNTGEELTCDLKIAIAGPLMHVPMGLFWLGMYASINGGDISQFDFRMYLTVLTNDFTGFFSTLFEQSCLLNIFLLWFNIFIPAYPLDGGRLITSSILSLTGVALIKTALLTCFVTFFASLALFAWSIASFIDGVGTTGAFTFLVALYLTVNSYELYASILDGRLRTHPLFGRDCYINRVVRPPLFQLTSSRSAATSINETNQGVENTERDDVTNVTMVTEDVDSQTCARDVENSNANIDESGTNPETC